jgi:hypothetical protein
MSELDTLTEQFEGLLEGIRGKYTLQEWRYAYRKVIYSGAMKILEDFPAIIIGPPPPPPPQLQEQRAPTHGGGAAKGGPGPHPVVQQPPAIIIAGQRPPPYPSSIGELVCIALGDCHQPGQD